MSILQTLNPEQQKAVTHFEGPAIVLAGAGSGKTTVLTHRVAWLISQHKVTPESILLVTFTNKAAAEMKERVQALTGSVLPLSGTFHSICARILRRDGYVIGLPQGFTIYDTDDQTSLLKKIYKDNNWSTKDFNPKAVLGTISSAKNELVTDVQYAAKAYGRYQEHVARAYKLYQHHLKLNNAVDFDDLLIRTIELFTTQPKIVQRYQNTISHLLVDEYQDTNKAQYELTKLLAFPQNNLFVVGDFSQSIYSWRGADYRNMLSFKTDFPGAIEFRLERNYRSTQTILDAATKVISHNTSHPVLELWTDKKTSHPITVYEAVDGGDEAHQIVKWIREMELELELSDMAVLYRTNAQSRSFEESFVRSGIPYQVVGGVKFYERKEVKDSLAYLRYLTNTADTVSLLRLEKLGKRKLAQFESWRAANITDNLIPQLAPEPLLKEIFEITGFLNQFDAKDPDELGRLENIQELLSVASQFNSVIEFLENVTLVQNDFVSGTTDDEARRGVTLMSLHAAKGLEFSVVFLAGMEEGLLPHSRSLLDKEQLEEERRLCYVGITRAKDKLFISYAKNRAVYGYQGGQNALRSRFIADIPAELLLLKSSTKQFQSSSNPYQNRWSSNKGYGQNKPAKPPVIKERHFVPLDDDTLDGVLSGEIDIDSFLDS